MKVIVTNGGPRFLEVITNNEGIQLFQLIADAVGLPSAPNVAALGTATYANIPNGQAIYVQSRGRFYVSVPIGDGDVAGTGNDWLSMPSTSSPAFASQLTWHIDGNTGSDDNTGIDVAHPLKTFDEYSARMGGRKIPSGIVQNVYYANVTGINLRLDRVDVSANLILQPEPTTAVTTLLTTTVATFTARSYTNKQWCLITLTGVADMTPYVGKWLDFGGGTKSYVSAANPDGLGNATARISQPGIWNGSPNSTNVTNVSPAGGSAVSVISVQDVQSVTIKAEGEQVQNTSTAYLSPFPVLSGVKASIATTVTSRGPCGWAAFYCDLTSVYGTSGFLQMTHEDFFYSPVLGNHYRLQSVLTFSSTPGGMLVCNGSSAINLPQYLIPTGGQFDITYLENCGLQVVQCKLQIYELGIFGSTTHGLQLQQDASVMTVTNRGQIYGKGHGGFGVLANPSAKLISTYNKPGLTGTSGDFAWTNRGSTAQTWASDYPSFSNYGAATGTLAGGTVNISIKGLPADAQCTPTYNGVPVNPGSIYVSAQTTSQCTVTSTSGTDTSPVIVKWQSPSSPNGSMCIEAP